MSCVVERRSVVDVCVTLWRCVKLQFVCDDAIDDDDDGDDWVRGTTRTSHG
jgi:hypothetical protein